MLDLGSENHSPDAPPTPRPTWSRIWLVCLYFVVLAIVWTWPLVTRLSTMVAGEHRDSYYFVWLVAWCRHALVTPGVSLLFAPQINSPEGWYLANSPMTPLMVALALPLAALVNPLAGYNLSMLVAFVFSGLAMYGWAKSRTQNVLAALAAGTIFATLPYRTARLLAGHLNLAATFCLPLFFWALDALLGAESRSWRRAVLLALALVGVALSSQIYLYMILVVGLVYGLGYLLQDRQRVWRHLPELLLAAAVAVPCLWLISKPYADVRVEQPLPAEYVRRSMGYYDLNGADPRYYVARPQSHAWWPPSQPTSQVMDREEAELSMGYLPMALALLILVVGVKGTGQTAHRALLLALLWALVLSLGPALRWHDAVLATADLPWWPKALAGIPRIPLPARLLFMFLPHYAAVRISARYSILVALFVAMLAGIAIEHGMRRLRPRTGRSLAVLAILLVLVEFMPAPLPLQSIQPRPIDHWLAQQPRGGVLELPLVHSKYGPGIYATLTHGQPYLGAPNLTPQLLAMHEMAPNILEDDHMGQLQALGLRYLLLHDADYAGQDMHRSLAERGLALRMTLGDCSVFELPPASAP